MYGVNTNFSFYRKQVGQEEGAGRQGAMDGRTQGGLEECKYEGEGG